MSSANRAPLAIGMEPRDTPGLPTLSLLEARILGVLVEKQHTVADLYPLSLNALVAGCNQKSSRNPVLEATDAEVQAALDHLKTLVLVIESNGGRVARHSHNLDRVLRVPSQSIALLAVLMLRGPQTPGELRINCERLHRFADISSVQGFLQELSARPHGPLVTELPRQPGARENRWVHLLCGAPAAEAPSAAGTSDITLSELAALRINVTRLEDQVASLTKMMARLCAELGMHAEPDGPAG